MLNTNNIDPKTAAAEMRVLLKQGLMPTGDGLVRIEPETAKIMLQQLDADLS